MSLTQKKIKEQIELTKEIISDTIKEKDDVLEFIKKYKDQSNKIDIKQDEKIINAVDELNGLMNTITYQNGRLNTFEWVLNEMKTKKKKKEK